MCTFTVDAALSHGQTVAILGSCNKLGAWDETQAVPLTSQPSSSKWKLEIELTVGEHITYKYVRMSSKGRVVAWETNPNKKMGK